MDSAAKLQDCHVKQLKELGWFIIDDFLSEDLASSLRSEALQAFQEGKLLQHRFQFGGNTFEKPNIFEADLHDESLQEALPGFAEILFDDHLCNCVFLLFFHFFSKASVFLLFVSILLVCVRDFWGRNHV